MGATILQTAGRVCDAKCAAELFRAELQQLKHEELRLAYLDADLTLIEVRALRGDGTVSIPLRTVILDALLLSAEAVIVAHNHPGGSTAPSAADRAATRRLADVLHPLGIRLIDHLIFAGDEVASFRALGLL